MTTVTEREGTAYDLHDHVQFNPEKQFREDLFHNEHLWTAVICYEPGQATAMHQHPRQEEIFFVLEGVGNFSVGGREFQVGPMGILYIPMATDHDVRNLSTERLTVVFVKPSNKVARWQKRADEDLAGSTSE